LSLKQLFVVAQNEEEKIWLYKPLDDIDIDEFDLEAQLSSKRIRISAILETILSYSYSISIKLSDIINDQKHKIFLYIFYSDKV
jgi:hypothetical protein